MERVAVIGGARTPFVRAGSTLARHSFIDLGQHAIKGAIEKLKIDPHTVQEFVFGAVLVDTRASNFAREVIFRSGLPNSITAHSVSNYCISGLVAINVIAEGIRSGRLNNGLAGGSESMSRPALAWKPEAERFWLQMARARTFGERLKLLTRYRPSFAAPIPPSPKEPTTGLTMGQHCELTAQEFGIARDWQDQIALRSHQGAAKAQAAGYFADEIVAVDGVVADNLIRADTSLEKLARLKPVFDRGPKATITAGNASALTDGASVVYLMSESQARKEQREILGFIDAVEFAAVKPKDGLLMAPGLALPRLLQRTGLTINDIDTFEIHEAFAAQVASNLLVWEKGWAAHPEVKPIGRIPDEKINRNGGSIAIGHPFAATGGRLILSALNELKRSKQRRAAISVCAAGAMACAAIVSRD